MAIDVTAGNRAGDLIDRLAQHRVSTLEELHGINGTPTQAIREKHTAYLTPLLEEFIQASPFFLIATADGETR